MESRNRIISFRRLSDEELVTCAREGNRPASEYLLSKYRFLVEGKARLYYLAGGDHDDVVQEGMIGLYKAIRDFRSGRQAGFRAFAELCVTRQIITAVKTATRRKHMPLNRGVSLYQEAFDDAGGTLLDIIADSCLVDPEKRVLDADTRERLSSGAKDRLSDLELKVLGYYMQGMSYKEMADLLACPTKSVDNALQRAKRKVGDADVAQW
ncbi:MAG: RNA polymerase sporulation sigma factor SigH [Armatimonadota bacterium]